MTQEQITPEEQFDSPARPAPSAGLANGFEPVPAAAVTEAFGRDEGLAALEDTMPLPRYRPERLF